MVKYLIEYYQTAGYPHNIYLISNIKSGYFSRKLYGDWAFLNGLSARRNGLMLDLHNVTNTLWDRNYSLDKKIKILTDFINQVITKFSVDKLVICSWVGNIKNRNGIGASELLRETYNNLEDSLKEKFIGIVVDTTRFKKDDFIPRKENSNKSGMNSINEKTSPKPQLADSLNLRYLVDDSPNHLPDNFNSVTGLSYDLKRPFDYRKFHNRKVSDFFDVNKFIKSGLRREKALMHFLETIYTN